MATVTKESYRRLIQNRPYKWDEEEVNYRKAEGQERCENCFHFFTRKTDGFHTCEIFRPTDDSAVDPEKLCDFHTVDGENFPLLESD